MQCREVVLGVEVEVQVLIDDVHPHWMGEVTERDIWLGVQNRSELLHSQKQWVTATAILGGAGAVVGL